MSNLARKIKRKKNKKEQKELAQKIKTQVSLFKKLPTGCLCCGALFDKDSRAAHMTWQVKVYHSPELISLICPACIKDKT